MPSSSSSITPLADTNVISELLRKDKNPGVLEWGQRHVKFSVCPVTIEEMVFGFSAKPNPELERRLETMMQEGSETLPITAEIARCAGRLRGSLRRQGRPRPPADMLIAATALVHGLTLVTRNVRDFPGCGVRIVNPFR